MHARAATAAVAVLSAGLLALPPATGALAQNPGGPSFTAPPAAGPTASPDPSPGAENPAQRRSSPAATPRPTGSGPAPASTAPPPLVVPPGTVASDDLHSSTVLVLRAGAALAAAQAAYAEAKQAATRAQAAWTAANAATIAARAQVAEAQARAATVTREVTATRARLDAGSADLRRLARRTYMQGAYGTWPLLLAARSPSEFTGRLAFADSVTRTGDALLRDVAAARAQLAAQEARLAEDRSALAQAKAAAAERATALAAAHRAGATARGRLAAVVPQRQSALALVAQARVEDQRQYRQQQAESRQLAESIRSLAGREVVAPPQDTGAFGRPATGALTSRFGLRMHPILKYLKLHAGVDFARGDGVVYAADSGVVLLTKSGGGYGNVTVVDHGTVNGRRVTTAYAHQDRFLVTRGQRVVRGQPIGIVGSTGFSTGPHLHFEVRVDGTPVDPLAWM